MSTLNHFDLTMYFRYPSSFLKLLLIGFACAVLPLLLAFINANIAFDKLADQTEMTISNAVETTRSGHALQEQLQLMERSVRQYYVLQDESFFNHYQQGNTEFRKTILHLLQLSNNASQQKKLELLNQQPSELTQSIFNAKVNHRNDLNFLDAFNALSQQIESIVLENNQTIDTASSQLTRAAKKTQRNLFLQSLVLIPLALLVAAIITYMLARPIRRMDSAIKDLGEGLYDTPIAIDGPGDLRVLGHRLDWLRTELKELNSQKQQFLRHVSHELKTPLTAIREATELLHDGVGGILSPQQAEITQILRDNSIRLQKMIENLLNYTKQTIQPKLSLHLLDLQDVVNKVIQAHALSIDNKQLTIETQFNVPELIVADEEKLTIVLDNLISNAVKFTPNLGKIKVVVRQEKLWHIIEVLDSGPGLAKDDLDKLFDPFYRGDTLHKSLISGSGLGLTIAKDLVEAHGGTIQLSPSRQGAHFTVRLPRANKHPLETK
ncbi:MAG: HAMP domain-containing sensor histidine kinase [Methylophilaceae bacterium]